MVAIFIAVFPEAFRAFSATIAISRAFDLAMVGAFILIIPMVYLSYVRTKRMEKKIEELVRKDALKNLDGQKKLRKIA